MMPSSRRFCGSGGRKELNIRERQMYWTGHIIPGGTFLRIVLYDMTEEKKSV